MDLTQSMQDLEVAVIIHNRKSGARVVRGIVWDLAPGGCIDLVLIENGKPVMPLDQVRGGNTTTYSFYGKDEAIVSITGYRNGKSGRIYSNNGVPKAYNGTQVSDATIRYLKREEIWKPERI